MTEKIENVDVSITKLKQPGRVALRLESEDNEIIMNAEVHGGEKMVNRVIEEMTD